MVRYTTLLAVVAFLPAKGVTAAEAPDIWCVPHSNTARILAGASPNDVHSNWAGESYVGLSWSLRLDKVVRTDTANYVKGDLFSPRGGLVDSGVFIFLSEWACEQRD